MTQVFATPPELRAVADLADTLNETARGLEHGGVVSIDNIQVFDSNGGVLGVLVWRMEADSFGLATRQE